MNYHFKQTAGIGDIFFLQKVAKKLALRGDTVLWPVKDTIYPLTLYLEHYNILYIKETYNSPFIHKDHISLDFEKADQLFSGSVMLAKYKLIQTDWKDWCNYFEFKRNKDKENDLFYNVLKLKDNDEYIFVNKNYATPPSTLTCKYIDMSKFNSKIVEMNIIDKFTIFDWCKVLENAKEIHTVETSLNYIIEKLTTTDKLHMYSKWSPPNYEHIKMLFNKPWKYEY